MSRSPNISNQLDQFNGTDAAAGDEKCDLRARWSGRICTTRSHLPEIRLSLMMLNAACAAVRNMLLPILAGVTTFNGCDGHSISGAIVELVTIADGNGMATQTANEPTPMEMQVTSTRKTKSRVLLNFWLDVLLLAAVFVIGLISAVLHIVFPAPTMADGWVLWGLSFDQWRDIQSMALSICGLLALEHLVLHWNWVCCTIATRIFRRKQRPDEGAQAIYGVGMFIMVLAVVFGFLAAAMLCIKQPAP